MSIEAPSPGRGLWIGIAVGAPFVLYGALQLLDRPSPDATLATARWAAGLLVVHDVLLVPTVLACAWVASRTLPRPLRAPVVAGLLGTGLVIALALPGVAGLGNPSGNPTVHPFDATAAMWWALALVWTAASLAALLSVRRTRPARPVRRARPR
jgi:hypothetical protein